MTKDLNADADLIVGLHRVVRCPRGGRLQEFRWIHGLEVGLYTPNEGRGDQPHWRILLPENPVLGVCVDLTDNASGQTVSIPASVCWSAPRNFGEDPPRVSPLMGAAIELWNRGYERDKAGQPQTAFTYVVHWADGTMIEGEFVSQWRTACVDGQSFRRPVDDFKDVVKMRLREEAGLAPTPDRFLCDGLVPEVEARQAYLREVKSRPELQHLALHILRSCEV